MNTDKNLLVLKELLVTLVAVVVENIEHRARVQETQLRRRANRNGYFFRLRYGNRYELRPKKGDGQTMVFDTLDEVENWLEQVEHIMGLRPWIRITEKREDDRQDDQRQRRLFEARNDA